MHAGEEALFVLVPLAIVLWIDYRKRRKEKSEAVASASETAPHGGGDPPAD
ncbi:MAG TPA: hypothetical protein VHI31_09040 [Actinomycetota bacterium]|nr:hypothetical protein [Actinomycetota bacterium]